MRANSKKGSGKMAWIATAVFFMLLLIPSIVFAIGVTPAVKYLDFSPGLEETITLRIINSEHKDFKALIVASGELKQYTTLENSMIPVSKEESMKEFSYKIKLPEKFDKPGRHSLDITVMEFPESYGAEAGDAVITATAAVTAKLEVGVPYPGKYADTRLYIKEADVGGDVVFRVPIYNLGTEGIKSAKARVRIYGPTNELIGETESEPISLAPKEESEINAVWKADVNAGTYHAVVVVDYDGKTTELEENFKVGSLLLRIKDVSVSNFNLGGIAQFDILLESTWNQPIKDVFGELSVTDDKGSELAKLKTATTDIGALGEGKLNAYWNTAGIAPGPYTIQIAVNYAERKTEDKFKINVGANEIVVEGYGITAKAIGIESSKIKRDTILVILVVVMVAVNIIVLLHLRKSKKAKEGNK